MTWPSLSHDRSTPAPPAHTDDEYPSLDLHDREPATLPERASRADDAALVARIRVGDEAAFERMFRAYYNRLCVFVTRYVGAPDLAEELVEAVLARIWEHRAEWDVRGSLTAYLYTAARYQVLDYRRHAAVERRMRERSVHEGLAPGFGQSASTDDQRQAGEAADLEDALREAVERLPERCRVIFTLRWQHNLSYAEIATTLGVATKTVETQLNRAFKSLRERLRPYW